MCDYSLHRVASRPARLGDKLVTTRFERTRTRGFGAVGEPNVAVCLRPGTELAFRDDAMKASLLARLLPGSRFARVGGTAARFRQVHKDDPNKHHDALEFANGTIILLTHLRTGQHVTVLQLPPQSQSPKETTEARYFVPMV
jgi:hypothetical protein